ncbi:MAG: TolC family protein, partial [Bacteroidaceae bacterium]|nr:TolC family protein [Bacteroidaceae bacterium]
AKQYNELLLELQRNVQSAVKHGMATQNDLLKVKVKLNESELQMRKAQNGIRLATMNLCHYIGKPLTSEIKVVSEYPTVNYQPNNTQDVSARPEYQMLSKKVEVAQQNVKLMRSELLPKVSIIGTANYFYGGEFSNKTILDNKALGSSPSSHISALPPALSAMGPYASVARVIPSVESIPTAAMPMP